MWMWKKISFNPKSAYVSISPSNLLICKFFSNRKPSMNNWNVEGSIVNQSCYNMIWDLWDNISIVLYLQMDLNSYYLQWSNYRYKLWGINMMDYRLNIYTIEYPNKIFNSSKQTNHTVSVALVCKRLKSKRRNLRS